MQTRIWGCLKRNPKLALGATFFGALLASALVFLSGVGVPFQLWQSVVLYVVLIAASNIFVMKTCAGNEVEQNIEEAVPENDSGS